MALKKKDSYSAYYPRFIERFPESRSASPRDFIFFVSRRGTHGYMSNWLIEENGHFGEGGFMFLTSEHEYVFLKALTFGDLRVMKAVLRTVDPAKVKRLGLEVSPFREDVWRKRRYACMYQAVYNKFSQSDQLAKLLLRTGNKYLIEAAQYDQIFSIVLWEWAQGKSKGCKVDVHL